MIGGKIKKKKGNIEIIKDGKGWKKLEK